MEAKSSCFIFNELSEDIKSPFAQSSVSGLSNHQAPNVFMFAVSSAAKHQPGCSPPGSPGHGKNQLLQGLTEPNASFDLPPNHWTADEFPADL